MYTSTFFAFYVGPRGRKSFVSPHTHLNPIYEETITKLESAISQSVVLLIINKAFHIQILLLLPVRDDDDDDTGQRPKYSIQLISAETHTWVSCRTGSFKILCGQRSKKSIQLQTTETHIYESVMCHVGEDPLRFYRMYVIYSGRKHIYIYPATTAETHTSQM